MNPTQSIQTYLTGSPESQFHGREVTMVDQWEGSDNLLWLVECQGEQAVAKLYLDAGQIHSRREYDGQYLFSRDGLAPRPRWREQDPPGLPRPILVYEWTPGDPLDPADRAQVESLALAVARIHSVDANLTRGFSPHPISLSYTWKLLSQSVTQIDGWLAARGADQVQVAFAFLAGHALTLVNQALPLWKTAPSAPVHGDLTLENMVHSRGRTVLLDWEQFGLGDPALDAATFLHANRQELDEAVQARWLETYLAAVDQPGLAERIAVYDKLLPVQAVCFLLDGLRETLLSNELAEAGPEAYEATRQFLTETILASWSHAAQKLGCQEMVEAEAVGALFEQQN